MLFVWSVFMNKEHLDLIADCASFHKKRERKKEKKTSPRAYTKDIINTCGGDDVARTIKRPQCEAQTDKLSEGNQDNDFHLLNKQILIICPTD